MNKEELITKQESLAMRGIAIMAIMLHNYTHWLGPIVKENEYQFHQSKVNRIIDVVMYPDEHLLAHLLSFFGHYGVPIFVFLSGFGLVMKYEAPNQPDRGLKYESPSGFVWSNWKKLFLMMITGYTAFVMVDFMTPRPYHYTFWNVIGQLSLFSNLYDNPDHAIWPGPYWYFGVTLQLYLVYRFLIYPGKWSVGRYVSQKFRFVYVLMLAVSTYFIQLACHPESATLDWLRYNFIGAMIPFVAGVLHARHSRVSCKSLSINIAYAIISLFVIVVGSLYFQIWLIVPLFCIPFVLSLVKITPRCILNVMAWLGSISAAIFVCHPIVRKVLIPISHHGDIYSGLVLYVAATIVLATLWPKLKR